MKKKIIFTAGILVGLGLAFAGKKWVPSGSAGKAPVSLHTAERAEPKTVSKEQMKLPKFDTLEAKIERLRRWTRGEEPKMDRGDAFQILEEWSRHDAQAALDFVGEAPHFSRRNFAYAVPLAWLCRRDPGQARDWLLQQVSVESDRNEIVRALVRRIDEDVPAVALELVTATGVSIEEETFGELLGRVAKTQPQVALQALAGKPADFQQRALGPMLLQWAQSCPTEALAWYQGRGSVEVDAARSLAVGCMKTGQFSLGDLVSRLKLSPAQADGLLWQLRREGVALDAKTLGFFSERSRRRVAEIAGRDLEESPGKVLAFVEAAVGVEQRAEALIQGWSSWLESDRKGALDWLQQMPDRRLAGELKGRLERTEQLRDPLKALELARTIVNQEERREVLGSAVQRLTWEDPAVAVAWMTQNPADVPKTVSYGSLARRYLERDDAGAMAWIAGLGLGEARDEALSAAASFWARKEIDFATTAMAVIGDAQKRQRCMFSVYCDLSRVSTGRADQWLASQGLSEEVRQSWKVLGRSGAGPYRD